MLLFSQCTNHIITSQVSAGLLQHTLFRMTPYVITLGWIGKLGLTVLRLAYWLGEQILER